MATVLVVDDERGIREGLSRALTAHKHHTKTAATLAEARVALTDDVDCVLLDLRLTDGDGMAFLKSLRDAGNEVPVIVATAYGDSARTIDAMRIGAFDYVTKPFDLPALLEAVDRAVRQRTLAQATPRGSEEPAAPPGTLIGTSAAMLAVWKLIGRAAATDVACSREDVLMPPSVRLKMVERLVPVIVAVPDVETVPEMRRLIVIRARLALRRRPPSTRVSAVVFGVPRSMPRYSTRTRRMQTPNTS
jgi:CheY-like chemotaxis protein